MQIKTIPNRALAFVPALILFVLIIAIMSVGVMILARAAKKAVQGNPGDGGGPTTNTPPTDTFSAFIPYTAIPEITPEQLEWLIETSANPEAEFSVIVLRSTNLTDWVELCRTNTVNHQVVWDDPSPPYPNGFYKPLIVIP